MTIPANRFLPPVSPAIRFGLIVTGINVLAFTILRLAFWATYRHVGAPAQANELLQSLYLGVKFDLRLALLIAVPYLVLAAVPAISPARHPWARRLWLGYFVTVAVFVLLLYFVDFGHFGYLRVRLNASLTEHLEPLSVALRMVWETYPVVWGALGLGVLAAGYALLLRWIAGGTLAAPSGPTRPRWQRGLVVAGVAALCLLGIYGKWSWYPLRWSDAYFSPNEFVSALALNPVLFLADTYRDRSRPYRPEIVREHYEQVAGLLGAQAPDPETLSFARYVEPAPVRGPAPNLVVIHLESFAAFKVGVMGNRLDATPHFDAIARAGLLFDNFFVPAVPTARSVFTMLTGIPDYNAGGSASRNPLVVRQHTLVNALAGYERFYFLGGSASWGNIRGLLSQSIDDLQVFEEGDYDAGRADAWGVTDHDLFDKVLEVLKQRRGPFFAFVQTSGNHRPYTIPETGTRGFETARVEQPALQANGFDHLAAYNGLRFLDHAIGYFFRRARDEPYFRNTVFVLYGDHGNPAANDIPYQRLGLTGYHVPMVIYAPGRIRQPRRIGAAASLVDLLPTALGLMGIAHVNTALGRDLLAPRPARERFALLPEGILTDEFLLRRDAHGTRLYRYRSPTPTADLSGELPDKVHELQRLHQALFETSRFLLHHNRPRPHRVPP